MRTHVVLTISGPDRVGVVEEVAAAILQLGGNIETSRMVRLGGEFATLALVDLPADSVTKMPEAFTDLTGQGYTAYFSSVRTFEGAEREGWSTYVVEVVGADHEGIVHQIARGLAQNGVTIDSLDTEIVPAPVTGVGLFTMKATVAVPAHVVEQEWRSALADAAAEAGVDVEVNAL